MIAHFSISVNFCVLENNSNFFAADVFGNEILIQYFFDVFEDAVNIVIDLPEKEQNPLQKRLHELVESASYTGYGYQDDLKLLYDQHS